MNCSKVVLVAARIWAESIGCVIQRFQRSNLRPFGLGAVLLLGMCSPLAVRGQEAAPLTPRITGLKIENGNVIVRWEDGYATSQVQCQTNLSSPWVNVGAPTS